MDERILKEVIERLIDTDDTFPEFIKEGHPVLVEAARKHIKVYAPYLIMQACESLGVVFCQEVDVPEDLGTLVIQKILSDQSQNQTAS